MPRGYPNAKKAEQAAPAPKPKAVAKETKTVPDIPQAQADALAKSRIQGGVYKMDQGQGPVRRDGTQPAAATLTPTVQEAMSGKAAPVQAPPAGPPIAPPLGIVSAPGTFEGAGTVLVFPVTIEERTDEVIVRAPDFPEMLTSGATKDEALSHAADALEEAVLTYRAEGRELPQASALDGAAAVVAVRLPEEASEPPPGAPVAPSGVTPTPAHLIRMTHPDAGARSDGFATDETGAILVPWQQVEAMKLHGYVVDHLPQPPAEDELAVGESESAGGGL